MKKLFTGALVAAMSLTLVACGDDNGDSDANGGNSENRVAMIAKANSAEYWMKVKEGAEEAGEDLGVTVTFNGPDTESEGDKQINMLQSAINDNAMAIAFAPQDGAQDGAPRLIDEALELDIPVVIFDTPLAGSDVPVATVASDNEGMGAEAAERMIEGLDVTEGKIAIIAHGEVGTAAARRDGFRDWIEENAPGFEVVDVQNGQSDPAISRDKAQGVLQAHPDLVGFFGTDDDSVIAIADEVEAKGFDISVIGIDSSPDVITLVEGGQITGVITQDPAGMGYRTIEVAVAAARGEEPSEKNIVSESVWVTAENLNDEDIQAIIN